MSKNRKDLFNLLKDFDQEKVGIFVDYIEATGKQKKKDSNELQNPHIAYKDNAELASMYKVVAATGVDFDGKHVTIQRTGITFDYVAYKNRMLSVYPESEISVGVVYDDDNFMFSETDGKVSYTHTHGNPFKKGDKSGGIIGAYCVIKNKRGESLTMLNRHDIDKHKKVAKQSNIWNAWFVEMVRKTIIKKACKSHFDDIYTKIEEIDNKNYDLRLVNDEFRDAKEIIDSKTSYKDLVAYYKSIEAKLAKMSDDVRADVMEAFTEKKTELQKPKEGE